MALSRWADTTSLLGPERFRCSGRAGLALDLRATAMKSPRVAAPGWWPPLPGAGALGSSAGRSFWWRSGLKSGTYRHVTPDTPLLPLPGVLVAQGLEFCFNLAMMVHIIADLHILGGSFTLGPRVSVLPVPLQPPHGAADYGGAERKMSLISALIDLIKCCRF